MNIDSLKQDGQSHMDKALEHLKEEFSKIRAGKANPQMLSGIMVEYYGNPTPLAQVSNVSTPDSKTISIQPWEKSLLADKPFSQLTLDLHQ